MKSLIDEIDSIRKGNVEEAVKLNIALAELQGQIKILDASGSGTAEIKQTIHNVVKAIASSTDAARKIASGPRTSNYERLSCAVVKHGPFDRFGKKMRVDMVNGLSAFTKTITADSLSGGDLATPFYYDTIIAPSRKRVSLLDAIQRISTASSLCIWGQETSTSGPNNASIVSSDYTGDGQGSLIASTDLQFESRSEEMATIAEMASVAYQIMDDIPQLLGYIQGVMSYHSRYFLEGQILNGDGTGRNVDGVNTTAEMFDAELLDFGLSKGIFIRDNVDIFDLLLLAKYQCDLTSYFASACVLSEKDYIQMVADLQKRPNNGHVFAPPGENGLPRPYGMDLYVTDNQSADKFTVGAFDSVQLAVRDEWEFSVSTEDGNKFERNEVTLRIRGRYGLKNYRPKSIITGTISSLTS